MHSYNILSLLYSVLYLSFSLTDEIAEALGQDFSEENSDEKMELLLEFVFLTVPPEVEDIDYKVVESMRTYSNSSISPVPTSTPGELSSASIAVESSSMGYVSEASACCGWNV